MQQKVLQKKDSYNLVELVQNLALSVTSRILRATEYLARASVEVSFAVASD